MGGVLRSYWSVLAAKTTPFKANFSCILRYDVTIVPRMGARCDGGCKTEQPDVYATTFMDIGAVDVDEITLVASPVS